VSGTGFQVFRNAQYTVGGKTGTAQVVGLKGAKYNANATPERLRDNALFIAFAPADHPRIALALVVENAGWGAAIAAPIAKKALDYYLLGKRPGEKDKPAPPQGEPEPPSDPQTANPVAANDFRPGGETAGNKE
jgi:penicillin-binding protein 2